MVAASNVFESRMPGTLTRIQARDFLTYSYVNIKPGPNLNIIIGPNGSGKSSLICAIALGLAGKPSHLGRSKHIQSFIKEGKVQAEIMIDLIDLKRKNVQIKRVISFERGSEWFINDSPATNREIEKFVFDLNIRVGNLCQFLPQDKVTLFSKMSPVELLKSTELAIGIEDLYNQHLNLIELSTSLKSKNVHKDSEIQRIAKKRQTMDLISEDVERLTEYKRNKNRLELLKIKLAWTRYNIETESINRLKQQETNLIAQIESIKKEINPDDQSSDRVDKNLNKIVSSEDKSSYNIKESLQNSSKKYENMSKYAEELADIRADYKASKDFEKNRVLNLEHTKKIINEAKSELEKIDESSFHNKIKEIESNLSNTSSEVFKLHHEKESFNQALINLQSKKKTLNSDLEKLYSLEKMKYERLKKYDPDIIKAMEWIENNKNLLEGKVEGPLVLSVKITNDMAAVFENVIRNADLKAFICSDSKTCRLLTDKLRFEQNLRVNILMAPKSQDRESVNFSILKRVGFIGLLSDSISGPDMTLKFLTQVYEVDRIPIGPKELIKNVDLIISQNNWIKRMIIGNDCYSIKTSRYGNRTKSTTYFTLKPPTYLGENVDLELKEKIKHEIQNIENDCNLTIDRIKSLSPIIENLNAKVSSFRKQKEEMEKKLSMKNSLINRIEVHSVKLKKIKDKKIEITAKKNDAKKNLSILFKNKLKTISEIALNLETCCNGIKDSVANQVKFFELIDCKDFQKNKISEYKNSIEKYEATLNSLRSEIAVMQQKCLAYRREASTLSKIKDYSNIELPNELIDQLQLLPDSLKEIEEQIHLIIATNELNDGISNEKIFVHYQQEKEELASIEKRINSIEKEINEKKSSIESIKKTWLVKISEIISSVSQKYSKYLQHLGYAGEVLLDIPSNQDDFANYGIKIMVKYRDNEPLQKLDAMHQSGGERSVATVLYMLALQNLTTVPFRCIDEINQGMDPVNERKVFNMIVDNTCESSKSQYFLLTPKLLKGLAYHENLSILCIFPRAKMKKDWDLESLTESLIASSPMKRSKI